jgi:predicted amino acid racemase
MDLFEPLARRNPGLVAAAAELHQSGVLPPDCYVADLDAIGQNATLVRDALARAGLEAFFEAKQFGRSPPICRLLVELGFERALAIDIEELHALDRQGIPIGHAGHLGQIPSGDVEDVVARIRPQFITVYSYEKAEQISLAAGRAGILQKLVLRVNGPDDLVPFSIAGGVTEKEALSLARRIEGLEGVALEGVTTYPAVRFDLARGEWVRTANFETMLRIIERLRAELDIDASHVNAAGNVCAASAELVAAGGATHCEPGQAFVGGLVANGFRDEPEVPAVAYVTEVSHFVGDTPYVYAPSMVANNTIGIWNPLYYDTLLGSLSRPGHDAIGTLRTRPQHFAASDPTAFMFNSIHPLEDAQAKVGDTVVLGFRAQLYRANGARLAVLEGVQSGSPNVVGVFDRNGNPLDGRTGAPLAPAEAS